MDKDRIAGAAKGIKGSVKETIGKLVGDAKLQSDGKAEPSRRDRRSRHTGMPVHRARGYQPRRPRS